MKRLLSFILVIVFIIGIGIYYFNNLNNNYHLVHEFYDFPIPNGAKLVSETQKNKNYRWEPAKGTGVPLSYRLMIKKSGWEEVNTEGANIVYEKNGKFINIGLATGYFELLKDSK
ncbi:hypothetical protein D1B31_01115 [Neobacillus notoginsengisoli]|uniref:Uncharacterized protein n=1 Tax=Neobacillus notoginsengisoli TaxID=1578198 RepID=A0A417YZK7_9BACI|nr:hypothetical protein [Neobacillus notoginsengisoli]RHW43302.1 hypothetical protein D1B31_01115 [Neobacillus notoginsengisoli]